MKKDLGSKEASEIHFKIITFVIHFHTNSQAMPTLLTMATSAEDVNQQDIPAYFVHRSVEGSVIVKQSQDVCNINNDPPGLRNVISMRGAFEECTSQTFLLLISVTCKLIYDKSDQLT